MDKNKKQLHDLARQIHNLKTFFFKKKYPIYFVV